VVAVEVNLSCPNTEAARDLFAHSTSATEEAMAATAGCRRPRWAKLSPNVTDVVPIAAAARAGGAEAVTLINTVMGMAIDVKSRRPVIGNIQGGLSGPAIKPIALLKVHQVYEVAKKHNVPIIGQGGIATAEDALEFMIAGATTVGLGTALFYDPLLCRKINAGVAEYLAANKLGGITELVGSLRTD
jgi:dihydroorotate dehydrogenase (NAD+) catalytic subunit